MSIDLESILNQTFNDEYNRITSRPVGNAESNNINDIFINIDNITECLICCEDDKNCVKCFQCTAYYCKGCLIKIASDFNKCSTCGVTIKDNYKKLKEYNQELQEQLQFEKAIADSINEYTQKNNTQNNNNHNSDNSDNSDTDESESDEETSMTNTNNTNTNTNINTNANANTNTNNKNNIKPNKTKQNNGKINLKPSLMNIFKKNKNSNTNSNNKEDLNDENQNNYNYNYNFVDKKKSFIQDLREDKIYNINFTSYINTVSENTPNYSYEWNHNDKTLVFYSLCNQNKDFINIIINYNILKSTFQSVLYIWLNEIVKNSFITFKTKWNKIAILINEFSLKDYFVTNQEIKKITKDIINICKN